MNSSAQNIPTLETRSRVIHWAFWYDVMLKVFSLGRERQWRQRALELAGIAPSEIVLDAGCGTGTLAIAARERVGQRGAVYAIDASPEMIARARQKAAKARAEISFQPALLEAIPFADAKFDVVITSFMLHHFPADLLPRCLAEIRRVLKPDGRLVACDFAASGHRHSLFRGRNHPHNTFNLNAITPTLNAAGLVVRERGAAGFAQAVFIRATPGDASEQRDLPETGGAAGSHHNLPHLAMIAALGTWLVSLIAVALFFIGRRWMWFGAGAAGAILSVHIATHYVARGLGGTSLAGYAARWLHRWPPRNGSSHDTHETTT